jgi:opine dehydrogenase
MRERPYRSICICGGGSLGHAIAAVAGNKGCDITLLSGHPELWHSQITAFDCEGQQVDSRLQKISSKPQEVIPQADLVLLCVPGYLIEPTLKSIVPYLSNNQMVGSVVCSNGFFWIARSVLGSDNPLFGFQRVPFICRVREYGKSVEIKGRKSQLKIAGLNNANLNDLAAFFSWIFETPTSVLHHFLEATLTNSNPILHPARIYAMLSEQKGDRFDKEFLFYEEWDNRSSEILIDCDREFQSIIRQFPINPEEIPSLLSYYESTDASSLTRKIQSIKAFKGIKMSMKPVDDGFEIDYSNRYFTEDIPFGLLIIKSLGVLTGIPTPRIDEVLSWIQTKMGKEYVINGTISGADIVHSGIIQNYHINTEELFKKE